MDGRPNRGSCGVTRALVVIGDDRVALAIVLVLQEMDLAVDIAVDGAAAVAWARRERYDLVVCGPGHADAADLAVSFRLADPDARVVLIAGADDAPRALDAFDIEVIDAPLDVNALMWSFRPAAA